MDATSGFVPERESEFTGLKGTLLKYTGCTYALVIASQFIEALALSVGDATGALFAASRVVFVAAFVAYPAGVCIARAMRSGKRA